MAYTADAIRLLVFGITPSVLISFPEFSPSHPNFSRSPTTRPCYVHEDSIMFSEWQKLTTVSVAEAPRQKPSVEHFFPSPESPAGRGRNVQRPQQKRSRALADVDGDNSDTRQRKKRRLRRDLITSRLSRPYASPATHIISRNAVRLGIWTGRRYIGRNVFRKAAILNSMRRERAGDLAEKRIALPQAVSLSAIYEHVDPDIVAVDKKPSQEITITDDLLPRQGADVQTSLSPPATTNYDIFDDEDIDPDEDEIYVGILDGSDLDSDDSDDMFPFNDVSVEHTIDPLPKDDSAWRFCGLQGRPLAGQ